MSGDSDLGSEEARGSDPGLTVTLGQAGVEAGCEPYAVILILQLKSFLVWFSMILFSVMLPPAGCILE